MPPKRRSKKKTIQEPSNPPQETASEAVENLHVDPDRHSLSQEDIPHGPTVEKKAKVVRTTTSYTDEEKEEIIDFLKVNPSIYEKRRADYKNTQAKEILWQEKADSMGTSVNELKTWYNSQRTRMGRLKQLIRKSGQGAEEFTATDQWVWNSFQFLLPHIVENERRNVVSFKSKIRNATESSNDECQLSSNPEGDATSLDTSSSVPSMPSTCNPEQNDNVTIETLLKEFLTRKTSDYVSPSSGNYFALYVENTLKKLPGALRREAEFRIQQILHDVEDKAEQQNQSLSQDIINWQPHPNQPSTQNPIIWHAQNKPWTTQQRYTSPASASSFGTRVMEHQTDPSSIQGRTYTDLQVIQTGQKSQADANSSSFNPSFIERMTTSAPLRPIGEDGMYQATLDLPTVTKASEIPRELEADHQ